MKIERLLIVIYAPWYFNMNIIESIKFNNFEIFQNKIENQECTIKEENLILETIVDYNNISFLSYLLNSEDLFFINYDYLIRTLVKEDKKEMFSLTLNYIDDHYNNTFTSSLVFSALEYDSFNCAKILLEHPNFDLNSLTLDLLNMSAYKKNDFCFYYILDNINLTKEHNISNLIKICIKNSNKSYLNEIFKKVPDHDTDFAFIYNSLRIINDNDVNTELQFMIDNLDLSGLDNKLLKKYINSNESKELNLIVKNKYIQESLTEKWLYKNCKYQDIIESLKKIVLKNKISKF